MEEEAKLNKPPATVAIKEKPKNFFSGNNQRVKTNPFSNNDFDQK